MPRQMVNLSVHHSGRCAAEGYPRRSAGKCTIDLILAIAASTAAHCILIQPAVRSFIMELLGELQTYVGSPEGDYQSLERKQDWKEITFLHFLSSLFEQSSHPQATFACGT